MEIYNSITGNDLSGRIFSQNLTYLMKQLYSKITEDRYCITLGQMSSHKKLTKTDVLSHGQMWAHILKDEDS